MARIDFYVVTGSGELERQRFACRLAEKAYRKNNIVHIQVRDATVAQEMNQLLWTFRDGSFVPHEIIESDGPDPDAPVTIGVAAAGRCKPDLLINLMDTMPIDPDTFPRVAEIVTSDESSKSRGREHFVAYRNAGHTLETHKL